LDFKATKNELESFTYDLKNNIDSYGPMEKNIEESQRVALMQRLQQTIDWIYGDGQQAPTDEYKKRLEEFKKIAFPIKARFNFRSDFPVYVEQFNAFVAEVNDKLAGANTLTEQIRADILSKVTEMGSFFNYNQQLLTAKQTHEDLGLTIDEVLIKLQTFKQTVNTLFNTPPPKPEAPKQPE